MADDAAWSQGWSLGSGIAERATAHKQAMADEEHEGKLQDLISQRSALVSKIPTLQQGTPEYDQAYGALKQVNAGLVDLYHPQKNPGAIQKFGHLLTDHLGIKVSGDDGTKVTLPVHRQQQAEARNAQGQQVATQAAQRDIAAGPLSPEQQGTQRGQGQAAEDLAVFNGKMRIYDQQNPRASSPDATPEEKQARQEYANSLLQGPSYGKEQLGKWDRILGKVNGKPATMLYNEKTGKYKTETGEEVPQEVLDSFIPDPKEAKPGTSKFSVNVESYKKMHGIPADQSLTPDQLNFVEQQIALSSGASSTNITNTLKQDVNGMWVPIQESNRHISGFGTILSDPMGKAKDEEKKSTPTTPSDVKKKAEKLKPTGATPATPAGGGNVKVGAPLFQGRTPNIDGAQKDVKEAVALDSLAKQVQANPNEAINQKRLAVALERVSAGRFTVQALDYIIKAGWGNTIDQWALAPTTGGLPPDVVKQLVDGAHENLVAKQDALKYAITPIGANNSTSTTGGATPDAAAKSLADRLHEAYGTKTP